MERRSVIKTMFLSLGTLLFGSHGCTTATPKTGKNVKKKLPGMKMKFLKLGTCSRLYFHTLNQQFGNEMENEEKASDPLAGGILQRGHQCGMLWGASLATGTQCFNKFENQSQAMNVTLSTTREIIKSFTNITKSVNCKDVSQCDYTARLGVLKCLFSGGVSTCFSLADKWAPEAVDVANQGITNDRGEVMDKCTNCAAEVALKMGASEKEMTMVSGFAGGLGLSGNACGALATAVWMKALKHERQETEEGPNSVEILKTFYRESNSKIRCDQIAGREFKGVEDHSEYVKQGGCKQLIESLAKV